MKHNILLNIREHIYQWEMDLFRCNNEMANKIALFDLDNTLIVGDIGEAVFVQLLISGLKSHISWEKYKKLRLRDAKLAYVEIVKAMSGLNSEYVIQITRNLLKSNYEYLIYDGDKIKIPKQNTIMREIINMLQNMDYKIYIISASNDVSVKVTASMFFHISSEFTFGIKSVVHNGKLTDEIIEPVPVGFGKVQLYNFLIGKSLPFIVASDSELDLPLFELCDNGGIALIVGENKSLIKKVKRIIKPDVNLINIPVIQENNNPSEFSFCNI